jgi:hypothetical protein
MEMLSGTTWASLVLPFLREGSVARRSQAIGQFTGLPALRPHQRDPDSMVRLSEFDEGNFNSPTPTRRIFHESPPSAALYVSISRDLRNARAAPPEAILLYGTFRGRTLRRGILLDESPGLGMVFHRSGD